MKKLLALLMLITLLTGCATSTTPTPTGISNIIDSADMAWLGSHLDSEEWSHLSTWLKGSLIPYVSALEVE